MEQYLKPSWSVEHVPVFIPHLRGSGSPHKNQHTRGLLFGSDGFTSSGVSA